MSFQDREAEWKKEVRGVVSVASMEGLRGESNGKRKEVRVMRGEVR